MAGFNPDDRRQLRYDKAAERAVEILTEELGREPTEDEIDDWVRDQDEPREDRPERDPNPDW